MLPRGDSARESTTPALLLVSLEVWPGMPCRAACFPLGCGVAILAARDNPP